ncbi:Rtg1p [Sugiyamaella lignohabitans]|uniref:Rtg1p n=1 Tax=Sugiyamaella lignohabitans TaxID=796027 RepID=A0A161HL88_9ASCO|nr:Rtg1p [Sugiyamaella lignohabitans]ANB12778.1 Rtg1p [Sugiyamaella lignohabitans]
MPSAPYIKREDDDGGGGPGDYPVFPSGGSNNNNYGPDSQARLMSREVLTRGFNSFDDTNANQASSMIDESDLLDLEGIGSPEVQNAYGRNQGAQQGISLTAGAGSIPGTTSNFVHSGNSVTSATSAPRDFSRNAAQQSYKSNLPLGTTPPIPESTSPFDNFLYNQARFGANANNTGGNINTNQQQGLAANSGNFQQPSGQLAGLGNPQIHIQNQSHSSQPQTQGQQQNFISSKHNRFPSTGNASLGPGSYTSPRPESHVDRFMHENAIASNSSTPIGSYDGNYSTSPGFSVGSTGGGFSLPNYGIGGSSAAGGSSSIGKAMILNSDDKQQQLLERRRKRRESHNAVERRRRDNINEKIKELSELIPEKFLMAGMDQQLLQKGMDDRPNKGTILARSVDYIRQLQAIIDDQNRAELDLQDLVNSLQRNLGVAVTEYKYTSAELALSRLGIGPQISGATPPVMPNTGIGTGSGPDDLKSPMSNSSQSSRPTNNESGALSDTAQPNRNLPGGSGSTHIGGPTAGSGNNSASGSGSGQMATNTLSPSQHRGNQGGSHEDRSTNETPEFTPEFDIDFYQRQGYAPQDESAIFDDDYGYNR